MPVTVGEVQGKLSLDSSAFNNGLNKAERDFEGFGSKLKTSALAIGAAIGGALAVGSYGIIKGTQAFADYEKGLASVSKTTGITGEDLKGLGNELRDLATQGPVTVGELEKIAGAAGSLGIGAQKLANNDIVGAKAEIIDFTKTISDMSIAFEMGAEQTATAMAGISNVYQVPTEGLAKLGSQINVLENNMRATAPQIIDFMSGFGGIATLFDVPAEKAAAFGATLSSVGVEGSEASTQIKSGVLQLTQAVNVSEKKIKDFAEAQGISVEEASAMFASGQENIVKLASIMGISVDELKHKLNTDLTGTLVEAGQSFAKLEGGTEKAAEAQKIFGSYGFSALVKVGQGAQFYVDAMGMVQVKGNEMQKEATTMANTISGQWQRMKNGVNDVGISVGEITSGPLYGFMDFMNNSAIPAAKEFVTALGEGDFSVLDGLKEKIKDAFSFSLETGGFAAVGVGVALMAKSVIASLTGMSVKSIAAWATMKAKSLSHVATMTATTITQYAKMATTSLLSLTGMAGSTVVSFAGMMISSVASIVTMAAGVIGGYVSMAIGVAGSMATIVGTTVGSFIGIAAAVAAPIALVVAGLAGIGLALNPGKYTEFGKIASQAFNGLKDVVSDCWELINAGDFSGVIERLKQAMGDAWNAAKAIDWRALGSEIVTMIGDGAKAVMEYSLDLGDWIYTKLQNWVTANGPNNIGKSIGDAIINGIIGIFQASKDGSIVDKIKTALGVAQDWLNIGIDIAKGIGGGLYDSIEPYINKAHLAIYGFITSSSVSIIGWKIDFVNAVIEVANTLDTKFKAIAAYVSGTFTTTFSNFKTLISTVNFGQSWDKVENFFESLAKSFTKLSSANPTQVISAVKELLNTDWVGVITGKPTPGEANSKLYTQSVNTDIKDIASSSRITSTNTGENNVWLKRNNEDILTNANKNINVLKDMGYGIDAIAKVGEKQLGATETGLHSNSVSIKQLADSTIVNNGSVQRYLSELKESDKKSDTWKIGSLDAAKKGVEQQKLTADKTTEIAKSSLGTEVSSKATEIHTGETTTAIKDLDGIQKTQKYTNPISGKEGDYYPEQIERFKEYEKLKAAYDYAENKVKSSATDAANTEKTGALDETKIETEGMKKGVDILGQGIFETNNKVNEVMKNSVDVLKNGLFETSAVLTNLYTNTIPTTTAATNALTNEVLVGGSQTAANAINLGLSEGAGAVKIGLTESGQEIAIIGKVAQAEWAKSGNTLYSNVDKGATTLSKSVNDASKLNTDSAKIAAQTGTTAAQTNSALGISASNQKTTIEIMAAMSKRSIETNTANIVGNTIMTAGWQFAAAVVSGARTAAAYLSSITIDSYGIGFDEAAQGAHLTKPTAILAGEAGDELILPSNLTNMFVDMAKNYRINKPISGVIANISASNLNNGNGNFTINAILNIDGKKLTSVIMPIAIKQVKQSGMKIH